MSKLNISSDVKECQPNLFMRTILIGQMDTGEFSDAALDGKIQITLDDTFRENSIVKYHSDAICFPLCGPLENM